MEGKFGDSVYSLGASRNRDEAGNVLNMCISFSH